MAQYIDKSALVAEIDRLTDELYDKLPNASKVENGTITISEAYNTGKYTALESFRNYIDTLEVKEVDLDTDFGFCWGNYIDCGGNINDYEVAEHFFELGLQAQKRE